MPIMVDSRDGCKTGRSHDQHNLKTFLRLSLSKSIVHCGIILPKTESPGFQQNPSQNTDHGTLKATINTAVLLGNQNLGR